MTYNFEKITDRRGTNSLKWDFAQERGKPDGLLPLWVADMDFPAPPEVLDDIQKVIAHGIFGYTEPKQAYYDAVSAWFSSRFGFDFTKKDIVKAPGVVYALAMCVRAYAAPDDAVLIQPPVYYPFSAVVRDNGRRLVTNPLVYENGEYSIDFEDFERKIAENSVKLFILCSPHNPVGRVWTRAELTRIHEICAAHGVVVASDEIHCDFVFEPHRHTCYGLIDENAVTLTAPSKTFNLAGLQTANVIVKNAELRHKLKAETVKSGYSQLNTVGLAACESAYTKGGAWLAELKTYLAANIEFTRVFIAENMPKTRLTETQGTYLLWLDFSVYGLAHEELNERVTRAGLWLDGGTMFGAEGAGFQRINVACPRATLEDALRRLARF